MIAIISKEAGSGATLSGLKDAKADRPASLPNSLVGSMQSKAMLPGFTDVFFLPSKPGAVASAAAAADSELKKATTINLAILLRSGVLGSIAWDEFLFVEVLIKAGAILVLDEAQITGLMEACEQLGMANVRRAQFKSVLHMVAKENRFDSAQDWLWRLPPWDRVKRVEGFLPNYCGTASAPYEHAVGRYLWTAMVARILEPGCKVDMVPVLVGKQGVLKSSLLTSIAPTPGHCGDARLTDRPSDLARKVLGMTVVVWEELRGIRGRVDADEVKTFITSPHVELPSRTTIRMDRHFRRFVIFGTANRRDFLRDPSGERRYLPFDVVLILLDRVKADKAQLWAEALHMALQRRENDLPLVDYEDAERLAVAEHQKYRNQARWFDDEALLNWLQATKTSFRTDDALKAVGLSGFAGRLDRLDMANSLRQIGLELKPTYVSGATGRPKRWNWAKTPCSQQAAPRP